MKEQNEDSQMTDKCVLTERNGDTEISVSLFHRGMNHYDISIYSISFRSCTYTMKGKYEFDKYAGNKYHEYCT